MNCDELRKNLTPYLEETLEEPARRELRRHLSECSRCREAAIAQDPSLLFLPLGESRKDEFFWASFWRDLRVQLRPRPARSRPRFRAVGWVAAAAVVVAAAATTLPYLVQPGPAGEEVTPRWTPPHAAEAVNDFSVTVDDPDAWSLRYDDGSVPIVMVYDQDIEL
jgi:hypothetical protein